LMDLVVESAEPDHGIRRGWFGREEAPAGGALTFECELGYTLDPAAWRQGRDAQLEKAIDVEMQQLKEHPLPQILRPQYPNYHEHDDLGAK